MTGRSIHRSELPASVIQQIRHAGTGIALGPNSPLLQLRKRPEKREHFEQVKLFEWADLPATRAAYPELEMLYAVPNFSGRLGRATAKQGAALKAEGRRPGVPDISLDVARGGFHAFRGELKVEGGSLTGPQREWRDRFKAYGYYHVVAVGWEAMRDELLGYLELRHTQGG